ncbi:MAG TPA: CAP domain-containing protein [Luteolibacter sp.]|nr:CAP domain-containing protein [Luteolibacter sp.]
MKSHPSTRMVGLLCAAALASCASKPESTRLPVAASLQPDTSMNGRVFEAVNAYRRGQGAGTLQRHAGLDRLALKHSEYLRKHRGTFSIYGKNVSHHGFDGRAALAQRNYQMLSISENVAAAYGPGSNAPSALLDLWRGSKDHHKNMTDEWTHTGVGVVVDSDGTVFATQLFATRDYSQMAFRERMNQF